MIRFEDVTVTYPQAQSPALRGVNLEISEGELALLVGRTGSGKSTLLRAINGLVPTSPVAYSRAGSRSPVVTPARIHRVNSPMSWDGSAGSNEWLRDRHS